MSGVGDLNTRVRRPSVAGSNTQVIINKGGVEGASPNLTFDGANLVINGLNILNACNTDGTLLNGAVVQPNTSNINYNSTTSVIAAVTANGTTNTNVSFSVNATMNLTSLNVTANISNTGNILVTQNTVTGNLSVTQNTTGGNASFANVNVSATINTAANLVAGNISTPQNTSTGNLSVTTLANTVTLNVSTQIFAANATVNAISFIPVWTAITCNVTLAPNSFSGVSTNNDTAGFWKDPFGIVHLRGLICANTSTGVNVANTLGNVTFANIAGYARNIANGLPAPTAQTFLSLVCANVGTTTQIGNVICGRFVIQTNGALQCINVEPVGFSSNMANVSLYSVVYSTI